MSRHPATLLQRLRLHKGVWMLLALAVFIKVASATVCLLDGPRLVLIADARLATADVVVGADPVAVSSDEVCLLGEPSGCHCACAHASTLPAPALAVASTVVIHSVDIHLSAAPSMRSLASPLRPPIA